MSISFETLALAKAFTKSYVAEHGSIKEIYEYASTSNFPAEGESECLYVALDTGKVFRWGTLTYVEVSPSTIENLAVAGNNGKVVGIVDGSFAAVNPTRDALAGMDVAGNNGKVIAVQNGAFAAVSPETLFPDGDNEEY